MSIFDVVTDPYNRRARLSPSLLALLPLLVLLISLFPDLEEKYAGIISLIIACGGAIWLTQLGRDRGKRLEPILFKEWEGKPSVAMLRHRDERIGPALKECIHRYLDNNLSNLKMPTSDEELAEPGRADDIYEAASHWLLGRTRDVSKFKVLFEENMNYGFRRNFLALKPLCIGIDTLILLFLLSEGISQSTEYSLQAVSSALHSAAIVPALVALIHLVLIVLTVNSQWVYVPAEAYARRLLEACGDF